MKCVAAMLMAYTSVLAVDVEKIADAIYLAEGGEKARVPYGILSVKVKSRLHARRVCINTINNNLKRWNNAGKPGDFISFLGDRYCPRSVDPRGNENWKRNVKGMMK